jgi:hypothetical protein
MFLNGIAPSECCEYHGVNIALSVFDFLLDASLFPSLLGSFPSSSSLLRSFPPHPLLPPLVPSPVVSHVVCGSKSGNWRGRGGAGPSFPLPCYMHLFLYESDKSQESGLTCDLGFSLSLSLSSPSSPSSRARVIVRTDRVTLGHATPFAVSPSLYLPPSLPLMALLEGRSLFAAVTALTCLGFLLIGYDNGLMGG